MRGRARLRRSVRRAVDEPGRSNPSGERGDRDGSPSPETAPGRPLVDQGNAPDAPDVRFGRPDIVRRPDVVRRLVGREPDTVQQLPDTESDAVQQLLDAGSDADEQCLDVDPDTESDQQLLDVAPESDADQQLPHPVAELSHPDPEPDRQVLEPEPDQDPVAQYLGSALEFAGRGSSEARQTGTAEGCPPGRPA